MKRGFSFMLFTALGVVQSCAPGQLEPLPPSKPPPAAVSKAVGAGFVLTRPPAGLKLPSNVHRARVMPKVTPDFQGPPTSSEFWSSLIWQHDTHGQNPYSVALHAHPLTLKAQADGLMLGYPTAPQVIDYQYMYLHTQNLLVGLEGLRAPDTRVAAYSDWTVTTSWRHADNELRTTFGHGLPFVYFTRRGNALAKITPQRATETGQQQNVEVWRAQENLLGIRIADHDYAAFGPLGSEWRASGESFVSDLAGKDFFSVALLPDRRDETLALFRAHAFAFVVGSAVSWKYDSPAATLRATFTLSTELKEPAQSNEPLMALYRHQWLNTKTPLLDRSYVSARGEMKLLRGSSFVTEQRFNGVLPCLPNLTPDNNSDLEFYVKQVYWQKPLFKPGLGAKPERDVYWEGKTFNKLAHVLLIADQIGYDSARDHLLTAIKNELEDWFDGHEPRAFYYDQTWRTLIGVPEAYFSSAELNDHHFQYAYFVFAAAVVALFDPNFVTRYGDFIDLLIRDAANWQRSDRRFPFLRYMDVYAGHSWANGPALFEEGNNEESSSEDVNFSAATILWGAITGKPEIRDLGIFLYTQQVSAIEQYWWDVDRKVFPKGFQHAAIGMLWGAGGRYDTWFDPNPIFVHGINTIPISAGSLYMGRHPNYVLRNYGEIVQRNRRDPLTWRDILWMYLAFADPERAKRLLTDKPHFTPEFGNSKAMTRHWIWNLGELGQLDTSVTANTPTYAVFKNGRARTHVAFNPTRAPLDVEFSDGLKLRVAPLGLAHAGGVNAK